MTTNIHPTAVIDAKATLGNGVQIGPFCVVGPNVTLGDGVKLHSHVVVEGDTAIGEGTEIYSFAVIGHQPQDLKFKGEASSIVIGKQNVIREHVTIHPGTEGGGLVTRIGDHCLFMVGSHIAHDCQVGNHVILANNATLAGHVIVEDHVVIGGLSAVHQHVRIGQHAMIGGMSGIEQDVIPYGSAMGERASLAGLNLVGLKRRGFSREAIHQLRHSYKALFADERSTLGERLQALETGESLLPEVQVLLDFLKAESGRAVCMPKPTRATQPVHISQDVAKESSYNASQETTHAAAN